LEERVRGPSGRVSTVGVVALQANGPEKMNAAMAWAGKQRRRRDRRATLLYLAPSVAAVLVALIYALAR
jgi:hypothetical protein